MKLQLVELYWHSCWFQQLTRRSPLLLYNDITLLQTAVITHYAIEQTRALFILIKHETGLLFCAKQIFVTVLNCASVLLFLWNRCILTTMSNNWVCWCD